ncbi:MAG: FIST C-terminal domain-containing protein [Planctomycetes bacterium]|nr:FIST C-terminal domain-containing protein [Planctomycetota bacterium]
MKTMNFKAAISTNTKAENAVAELCDSVSGVKPDLAMLFVSPHFEDECDEILAGILEKTNAHNLIGCTGDGIIGPTREVEHAPAVALWTAELPGVRVMPFVLDIEDVKQFETDEDWTDRVCATPEQKPSFVVLPEPFTFGPAVEYSLQTIDRIFSGGRVVGGLASAGQKPGENRMFLNDQVMRQGMVGVSLSGDVAIESVVSQGCRPIGEPLVVTKSDQNVIQELRGRPAMEVLQSIFRNADAYDQALMQAGGIHVGSAIAESESQIPQNEFLIRNLMGVVENTGIAVAALVKTGQTIQFHVRDSKSADQEMKSLVKNRVNDMKSPPSGGLLFTCNGRGSHMFGAPNHDIGIVNEAAENCEVAGFFAAGEIGPVGNRTFIHGFTSSLILFRKP